MPVMKSYAEQDKESSYELMKLAKRLRGSQYFSDVKAAFLISLNSLTDFERYLIFKMRYRDELSTNDEAFVEKRFNDLYPGQDMSYIEKFEDYGSDIDSFDFDNDHDDWSKGIYDDIATVEDVEIYESNPVDEIEELISDPDESITNLFDGLNG